MHTRLVIQLRTCQLVWKPWPPVAFLKKKWFGLLCSTSVYAQIVTTNGLGTSSTSSCVFHTSTILLLLIEDRTTHLLFFKKNNINAHVQAPNMHDAWYHFTRRVWFSTGTTEWTYQLFIAPYIYSVNAWEYQGLGFFFLSSWSKFLHAYIQRPLVL